MRILNINSQFLTNQEVLREMSLPNHDQFNLMNSEFQGFQTIVHTSKKYLSDPYNPCSVQTADQIKSFLGGDTKILSRLTKAEKLTLINMRPISLPEMVPLIEEAEDRFTNEELEELLGLLETHLPFSRPVEEEEEEEEGAES